MRWLWSGRARSQTPVLSGALRSFFSRYSGKIVHEVNNIRFMLQMAEHSPERFEPSALNGNLTRIYHVAKLFQGVVDEAPVSGRRNNVNDLRRDVEELLLPGLTSRGLRARLADCPESPRLSPVVEEEGVPLYYELDRMAHILADRLEQAGELQLLELDIKIQEAPEEHRIGLALAWKGLDRTPEPDRLLEVAAQPLKSPPTPHWRVARNPSSGVVWQRWIQASALL